MNATLSRFWIPGILFVLVFAFGYGLSRLAKPYPMLWITVHKLIGLGALVYLIVTLSRAQRANPLSPLSLALAAVAGVFFVATIVTGGLVSIEKPLPAFVGVLHKLTPYLTLASTAATLWLVAG